MGEYCGNFDDGNTNVETVSILNGVPTCTARTCSNSSIVSCEVCEYEAQNRVCCENPTGRGVCGVNTPVDLVDCVYENLQDCEEAAYGEKCEGDGECGTDNWLELCGEWDIYWKSDPNSDTTAAPTTM